MVKSVALVDQLLSSTTNHARSFHMYDPPLHFWLHHSPSQNHHRHQQLHLVMVVARSFTTCMIQVRFPDHLFHTNPILMLLMLCSVVTYSLAFSLELLLLSLSVTVMATPHARSWSIASGSVSLASVLGLLLSPPSSWPWLPLLLCFLLLTLLALALKLVPLVHQLLSRFSHLHRRCVRMPATELPL
ncbi:hypothetical protein ACE6H2_007695 [Prunus campanulata]